MNSEDKPQLRQWLSETFDTIHRHGELLLTGAFIQALLPVTASAAVFFATYQTRFMCFFWVAVISSVLWLWLVPGYLRLQLDVCRTGKGSLSTLLHSQATTHTFLAMIVFALTAILALIAATVATFITGGIMAFLFSAPVVRLNLITPHLGDIVFGLPLLACFAASCALPFSRLCLAPLIAVDQQTEPLQAFSRSVKLTRPWQFEIFLLTLATVVTMFLSVLIAMLFLTVFLWTALSILYACLTDSTQAPLPARKTAVITVLAPHLVLVLMVAVAGELFLTGIHHACVQMRYVAGASMEPAFLPNDRFMVESASTLLNAPVRRGDILVFHRPPLPTDEPEQGTGPLTSLGRLTGLFFLPVDRVNICRVIGLPGETVRVVKGAGVFINGQALMESYGTVPPDYNLNVLSDIAGRDSDGYLSRLYPSTNSPIVVPPGQFFMLGDSRNNSEDSHNWGFLDKSGIVGKAWLDFIPRFRFIERPNYLMVEDSASDAPH